MRTESHHFEASDEASDEFAEASDEASDEFAEASDEASDEFMEASDEASDEFMEASDEASDEFMEASDEASDEGIDEGIDEAINYRSRFQAAQNQARVAAGLANVQKREVNDAAAVRRSVNNRLDQIRGSGAVQTYSMGGTSGVSRALLKVDGAASARPVMITPALVSAAQFNNYAARGAINDKRLAAASAAVKRDVNRLAAAQKLFVTRETAARVKSDGMMSKKVQEISNSWEKRFSTELSSQKGMIAKNNRKIFRQLRADRRVAFCQTVTGLTGAYALTVYGNDRILSQENLTAAGVTAAYLTAPAILNQFARGRAARAVGAIANGLTYLGVAANPATIALALRNRQRKEFLAGFAVFTKITAGTPATINPLIALDIASGTLADLAKLQPAEQPAAVATFATGGTGDALISATVNLTGNNANTLAITVTAGATDITPTVAWMVGPLLLRK